MPVAEGLPYNAFTGMLETYEYPSGFKLKYLYDEWGNQHEVRTADAANTLLWKANAENQRGQLTRATMGNGTITDFEWDTYGFPQRNKVSKGSTILQNLTFSFNSVTGNLNARSDAKRNILETFDYDNLLKDRLTYWSATNGSAKTMAYASNGNVLKKSDVSTSNTGYLYETAKPNAVTKVVNPTSSFQQNSLFQSVVYTETNKVSSINQDVSTPISGSRSINLTYNPNDERIYTFLSENLGGMPIITKKYFLDNYEVTQILPTAPKHYHYLQGPDGLFAIMVQQGTLQTMYYVHKDYLGSLTAISDAAGNLVESLSYDPWGRRRNPSNWNDYNVTSTLFDRGFTGHEHLPQFGLINMNGRVYDPFLARFLSPDPYVQAPDYSQNFNRYSYCLNNPLKYVDPSGNSFMDVVEGFVNFLTFPGRVLSEGTAMLNDHINGRPQQEGYFHWDYLTGNAAPYDIPQSNVYFAIDYSGFLDWSGGPFTDASGSNWDYGWEVFDLGPFDSDFVYSNGSKGTAFNGKVFQFMRPYFKEVNNGNLNPTGQGGTPWMTAAEGQLGVTEIAGSKHNSSVIGYHATTGGFKDDETPWCSSFVNWSIKQSGIKGTNSARALSWSGWGQSLSNPAYGSIAIIDYGGGKGHVGFVAGVNSSGSIVLLGGNQSNMVRYSAFSPSSISGYAYPSGYSPNYTLPTLIINKAGGFGSTR